MYPETYDEQIDEVDQVNSAVQFSDDLSILAVSNM